MLSALAWQDPGASLNAALASSSPSDLGRTPFTIVHYGETECDTPWILAGHGRSCRELDLVLTPIPFQLVLCL